jgi:hypothetical protein
MNRSMSVGMVALVFGIWTIAGCGGMDNEWDGYDQQQDELVSIGGGYEINPGGSGGVTLPGGSGIKNLVPVCTTQTQIDSCLWYEELAGGNRCEFSRALDNQLCQKEKTSAMMSCIAKMLSEMGGSIICGINSVTCEEQAKASCDAQLSDFCNYIEQNYDTCMAPVHTKAVAECGCKYY